MTAKKTVSAVVVEEATELAITKMQPGLAIEANFAALAAGVQKLIADYQGVQITEAYVPQAKKDRAYLNALQKDIDQVRLRVKREYMAPVVAFEDAVKALTAPIKEASDAIDAQVKAFEERERVEKRAELVRHYTEFAPILAEAVPFERIEDPAWMLKATGITKAFEAIEARVERIAQDDATLDSLNLSHPIEAKAEFFATLDMGRAIARSKALDDQEATARRIEAEKAEFAASLPEPAPEPEPAVHAFVPQVLEEQPRMRTFTVTATQPQIDGIVAYLQSVGLTGTVSR